MIEFLIGDLLSSNADVIIHACNCQGAFGSGVAKAVKEKYPIVAEKYSSACYKNRNSEKPTYNLLGKILPVPISDNRLIINMFTQDCFGNDGQRYTSYDALDICLEKVKYFCKENFYHVIAMPYKMCCDRGGGNWTIVFTMLMEKFRDEENIRLEIWQL